ncbi:MAG: hypothetical protein JST59_27695 [Actinobacteria bacterium]|nr:hypothetical protein [Actinomycetota bacterium]
MHWFDRMSKQMAAVPTETTRRGVFRGAAVAAVVAPFAPGALAYANRRLKAANANEDCVNCLAKAAAKSQEAVAKCKGGGAKASALLQPKGGAAKGKGKAGMKPTEAAKRAACMGKAAKAFLAETTACAKFDCAGLGESAPPVAHPLPVTGPESSACPSGTTLCSGTLCCYAGDNCCPCASVDGGNICCAAVIQCNCC